jgi:hypothetical protein
VTEPSIFQRYRDFNIEKNALPKNATKVINTRDCKRQLKKRKCVAAGLSRPKSEEMDKRKVARGRQSGEGSNGPWYLRQI